MWEDAAGFARDSRRSDRQREVAGFVGALPAGALAAGFDARACSEARIAGVMSSAGTE